MIPNIHWSVTADVYSTLNKMRQIPGSQNEFEDTLCGMIILFRVPQNWLLA